MVKVMVLTSLGFSTLQSFYGCLHDVICQDLGFRLKNPNRIEQ